MSQYRDKLERLFENKQDFYPDEIEEKGDGDFDLIYYMHGTEDEQLARNDQIAKALDRIRGLSRETDSWDTDSDPVLNTFNVNVKSITTMAYAAGYQAGLQSLRHRQ